MPSSLPLKVKVSVDDLTGQFGKSISKVHTNLKREFGYSSGTSVTISQIKGVIVAEMGTNAYDNVYGTFRPYVPDVAFLNDLIDIEITYNEQYLSDLSFSLDPNPDDKYDFVSIALRDIVKGLGLTSDFRYNYQTKGLEAPGRPMTDFEKNINKALGENNSPSIKLANATKGHLVIPSNSSPNLKLYAPTTWKNLISLNFFIPQDNSDVSNILAFEFCKGMVYRTLSDGYNKTIFKQLLGWIPNKPSSTNVGDNYDCYSDGSTSMLMPYNGSLSISFDPESANNYYDTESNEYVPFATNSINNGYENPELTKYLEAFHPFFTGEEEFFGITGTSISILKKDGTWDLMELTSNAPNSSYKMSDWTFHFDESEYARTIDGYLRGRITYKNKGYYGTVYDSRYFVLDYLPQKVTLTSKLLPNSTYSVMNDLDAAPPQYSVRIYFSNTEGVESIVLERLKEGSRIPNRITITDVKKGFYDTVIDKSTTFTAIAYNKNGSSRGLPMTVIPSEAPSTIQATFTDNLIKIKTSSYTSDFLYEIRSLDTNNTKTCIRGCTSNYIDISDLEEGYYVLNISDSNSSISKSFKFRKQ